LKGNVFGIDRMFLAVKDDCLDSDHWVSGDHTVVHHRLDAFFDGRKKEAADRTAKNFAGELVPPGREWFDPHMDLGNLASAAGIAFCGGTGQRQFG
jgi:hypothetical protein